MKHIVLLIDAFGWSVLRGRSFLEEECPYRNEVRTILGFSSACIPSILTGQMPTVTGHWNLFYRSPQTSPFRWTGFLAKVPSSLRESRVVRKAVNEISKIISGYDGYFHTYGIPAVVLPQLDICETKNIYRPGGIRGARSVFDTLLERGVTYSSYCYHDGTDDKIFDWVARDTRIPDGPELVFGYFCGLDACLHDNLASSRQVGEWLASAERKIREILDMARKANGEVVLDIISDHGMVAVSGTVDIVGPVTDSGLTLAKDYIAVYDSTMARFWTFNEKARHRLLEVLGNLHGGRMLDMEELRKFGVPVDPPLFGEIIFLIDPGLILHPSFFSYKIPAGMHGYSPDHPDSSAMFMSNRRPKRAPDSITDFHDIILGQEERI